MEKVTDIYGNLDKKLDVGTVVESNIAIFTVGEICWDNKMVSMDKNKPYKITKPEHPMADCVRNGQYSVIAPMLNFSSLD